MALLYTSRIDMVTAYTACTDERREISLNCVNNACRA